MWVWWYVLKKSLMLAPEEHCSSRWLYTAALVGRQITTEKAKEKLALTLAYLRVLVLGNLQLPCKNVSLCILKKQKPSFSPSWAFLLFRLHDAELDLPDQRINIRWVFHLTDLCPIVIKPQLPEEDGDIPLWVPIPDHSALETPTHGFEVFHMVVESKLFRASISRSGIPGHRESITHRGKIGESAV